MFSIGRVYICMRGLWLVCGYWWVYFMLPTYFSAITHHAATHLLLTECLLWTRYGKLLVNNQTYPFVSSSPKTPLISYLRPPPHPPLSSFYHYHCLQCCSKFILPQTCVREIAYMIHVKYKSSPVGPSKEHFDYFHHAQNVRPFIAWPLTSWASLSSIVVFTNKKKQPVCSVLLPWPQPPPFLSVLLLFKILLLHYLLWEAFPEILARELTTP